MSDFFGKLKSGAEKVAFEADKLNRMNKAKGELEKAKGQLQAEYAKLGEMYFSNRLTGQLSGEEYDQACQAIDELVKQVEAKNAEVQKIEAETYGASAAQPVTAPAQPQPAATPVQATPAPAQVRTTKFCPNCGTEIPIETKFCTNCGSKV